MGITAGTRIGPYEVISHLGHFELGSEPEEMTSADRLISRAIDSIDVQSVCRTYEISNSSARPNEGYAVYQALRRSDW
jgi:hypothetical protein